MSVVRRLTWAVLLALILVREDASANQPSQNAEIPDAQAATLERLLDSHRFGELTAMLPTVLHLKTEQKEYYEGALAFHRNRLIEAKKLLESAVNTRDPDLVGQERNTALSHQQVFNALQMLGTVYTLDYHYGAAANIYNLIDETFGAHLADGGESIRKRRHINVLLKDVAPQTVSLAGDINLARTPEGYPIQIGGRTVSAIFDTGANVSQISESTAATWGLTPLSRSPLNVVGFGGRSYLAHVAVIPEVRIGSAALRNVVVVIAPDEQLVIPELHGQLRPVLGYPVAAALGKLTFSRDGGLSISAHERADTAKAPLWLGDESLLISLTDRPNAGEEMFMVDTGSASTFLTDRYVQDHRSAFSNPPPALARLAGGGGLHEIPAYTARHLPLWFGSTPIYLDGQNILANSQGGEADNYYGLIGVDVLKTFSSYTLDLQQMEFSFSM